jgi:hypothetical protein
MAATIVATRCAFFVFETPRPIQSVSQCLLNNYCLAWGRRPPPPLDFELMGSPLPCFFVCLDLSLCSRASAQTTPVASGMVIPHKAPPLELIPKSRLHQPRPPSPRLVPGTRLATAAGPSPQSKGVAGLAWSSTAPRGGPPPRLAVPRAGPPRK